jgi:hypothetical protein
MMTDGKYKLFILKIIIKNGKIYSHNTQEKETDRKKIILDLLTQTSNYLNKKNKHLPDTTLYIFTGDTYTYKYQDMPFFVLAKPKNRKGILFPDNTFLCHPLISECDNWDYIKEIVQQKCEKTSKINEIYFRGANTGLNTHNLRYLLSVESTKSNKEIPLHVIVGQGHIPMYEFCKYKYLLNLPGHQPWSFRFKYLFLMRSLIIDIAIKQHYKDASEESQNEKWINFFDDIFIKDIDFVELPYDWYEGKDNNKNYNKLLEDIEKTYNYYEDHNDKYNAMVDNATNKVNIITNNFIYESVSKLIDEYAERFTD